MSVKNILTKTKKGSILAFSLIIMTMMLAVAVGITSIGVLQKKDASTTQFSVQTFQIADGGSQKALSTIKTAIENNQTILQVYPTCLSGKVTGLNDMGAGTYDLVFLKAGVAPSPSVVPADCSDKALLVDSIRVTSKYLETVRTVEVAVLSKLIGWWKMDEGTGIKTDDSSGNGNVGTLYNGATWAVGKPGLGNAIKFDGVNDYVKIGGVDPLTGLPAGLNIVFPEKGTITFWMNASEMANFRNPIATGSMNVGIRFEETSAGNFGMVTGDDAGNYIPQPILTGMQTNRWYFVSYTWDTTTNKEARYIDGVQVFFGDQTHWPSNLSDFRIGKGFNDDANRSWKGLVDDVRLYNYVRTPAQILQDYQGN